MLQMQQVLDDVTKERIRAEDKLLALEHDRGRLQNTCHELKQEVNQMNVRLQQANADNVRLKSRLLGYEQMVKGFRGETIGLQHRLAQIREENVALHNKVDLQDE